MLYSLDSDPPQKITDVPHESKYKICLALLDQGELDSIKAALNAKIDKDMSNGLEIQTSSWMPGSDWTNTPFQCIYEKAARFNEELSAKFFGLLVWVVFMERPEAWAFGRYPKGDQDIIGLTYFRLRNMN